MKGFSFGSIAVALASLAITGCSYVSRIEAFGSTGASSPDGKVSYECGPERKSASGCYNAWTKTIQNGEEGEWVAAYCRDQSDRYSSGGCHGGGVPWWWWTGKGKIGDSVLKGFWFRDYASTEVNGVFHNDNPYGDAYRIPGPNNCYKAKGSIFCMKFMNSP